MHKEACITINGMPLDESLSMTIRVALESFASMLGSDGLGCDRVGGQLCRAYLSNIEKIRSFSYEAKSREVDPE